MLVGSQSFIHQGILSDAARPVLEDHTLDYSRNPLFIKEFFLTIGSGTNAARGFYWSQSFIHQGILSDSWKQ